MSPLAYSLGCQLRRQPVPFLPRRRLMASAKLYSLDTIQRLCAPVFEHEELKAIQWAGVFGSYAQGEQQEHSDVDFLVGFKNGTSWDDVYQAVYVVNKALPKALDKEADVLYMRNREIRGFVMLTALPHSKTVYGDDSWLATNRPPALKLLMDGYQKLQEALTLECEIMRKMGTVTAESLALPENAGMKSDLISLLTNLCDSLSFESPGHPFGSYFYPVSDWILNQRNLIERLRGPGDNAAQAKDLKALWRILDQELDTRKSYLQKFFMPVVVQAVERARRAV